jgi:hypothetical protein
MNERDFVYWLNGYLELTGETSLSPAQVQIVKDHLNLVLDKKTPSRELKQTPPPFRPLDPNQKMCLLDGISIDPSLKTIMTC